MGKRSSNPVDTCRKQERKKEKEKHRRERLKLRDEALLQKDPSQLRDELSRLKKQNFSGKLDNKGKKRLEQMEAAWSKLEPSLAEAQFRKDTIRLRLEEQEALKKSQMLLLSKSQPKKTSSSSSDSSESTNSSDEDSSDDSDTEKKDLSMSEGKVGSAPCDASDHKLTSLHSEETKRARAAAKARLEARQVAGITQRRWDITENRELGPQLRDDDNEDSNEKLYQDLPPDVAERLRNLKAAHQQFPPQVSVNAPMPLLNPPRFPLPLNATSEIPFPFNATNPPPYLRHNFVPPPPPLTESSDPLHQYQLRGSNVNVLADDELNTAGLHPLSNTPIVPSSFSQVDQQPLQPCNKPSGFESSQPVYDPLLFNKMHYEEPHKQLSSVRSSPQAISSGPYSIPAIPQLEMTQERKVTALFVPTQLRKQLPSKTQEVPIKPNMSSQASSLQHSSIAKSALATNRAILHGNITNTIVPASIPVVMGDSNNTEDLEKEFQEFMDEVSRCVDEHK